MNENQTEKDQNVTFDTVSPPKNPIEEAAREAVDGPRPLSVLPNSARRRMGLPEVRDDVSSEGTPIQDLLAAQNQFIRDLIDFVHNGNHAEFMSAQEQFILCQQRFIDTTAGLV